MVTVQSHTDNIGKDHSTTELAELQHSEDLKTYKSILKILRKGNKKHF